MHICGHDGTAAVRSMVCTWCKLSPCSPSVTGALQAHIALSRLLLFAFLVTSFCPPLRTLAFRRNYFVKCVEDCEVARAAKLERWHKLKRLVGDLDGVRKA